MSRKILCINFINGATEYIEAKRSNNGNFVVTPSIGTTVESLLAACRRADEIYVSSLFPSSKYDWETFPKVQESYLRSLVSGFVQRKRPGPTITTRHQYIRDIEKDGKVGSLVAFQSLEESEIVSILELLNRFRKKIKSIHTLPAVLAGAVVRSEKPSDSFLLIWTKGNISIIAIVGAEGLIKIARILPYGLPESFDADVGQMASMSFGDDIGREVIMTINYFKQKFREPAPQIFYLIGEDRLHRVMEESPLKDIDAALHSGFSSEIFPGIMPEEFNRNVHLFGSLLADETFNFLPAREAQDRRANVFLSVALGVLAVLIGLALVWTLQVPAPQSHQGLTDQVRVLQSDIRELQTSVNRLKPIEEKMNYYQSTFLNEKPPFINILQQIGMVMPREMVFDTFRMTPADKAWNCMITGKIKGPDWQSRLDSLRSFGRSLYSFSNVDVQNVTHSLGQAGYDSSTISFQMSLQFISGESGS